MTVKGGGSNAVCYFVSSSEYSLRSFFRICSVHCIVRRAVKPVYSYVFDSILETALGISILVILRYQIYFIVLRIYPYCTLPKES